MAYPDIEALLIPWLASILSVRALTDLPANLAAAVPLLQVTRISGGDDSPLLDAPVVDIDCFGADRAAANALLKQLRQAMRRTLPGQTLTAADDSTAVVGRVQNLSNHPTPYDNTAVRRITSTYQLHVKARS